MTRVPSVNELHVAENNEGLLLEGVASTGDLDRVGDRITEAALRAALPGYMTNPVVLWVHSLREPPIGKALAAEVRPGGRLWVRLLLPRPAAGTKAHGVYAAVKAGLVKALSIGARFTRVPSGNGTALIPKLDMFEISLAPVGVNAFTLLDSVTVSQAKCLTNGRWVTVDSASSDAREVAFQARLAAVQARLLRAQLIADSVALQT